MPIIVPMNTHHTLGRRRVLGLLAGAGAVAIGACKNDAGNLATGADNTTTTEASGATPTSAAAATSPGQSSTGAGEIPSETAGPYPGDGTNGPNILTQRGVNRSDIRTSIGTGSATADGVDLDIELVLVDASTGKALPGAAVYLWHCDREARYSMYNRGVTGENYLRGVQAADGDGRLRFNSVFPGDYAGRWPHIHFAVFDSAKAATNGRNARKISQLALPEAVCREVYASSGYAQSQTNFGRESLARDGVFRDGYDRQLATTTGSVRDGYTATLVVGL